MAVTFGFFNSQSGDRKYDADQMNSFLDGVISDGIIASIGQKFLVTRANDTMVSVGTGKAWFNRKWIYNDSSYFVTLPTPHATLGRIDEIVIEVNNNVDVRSCSIKVVSGPASSTPTRPILARGNNVNQYSIATVTRRAGQSGIIPSDIVNRVGTGDAPYATSINLSPAADSVTMRRNTFRGKLLGDSITTAQVAAIRNGSFDDFYIGDYWILGGNTWRVVDINYYTQVGQNYQITNHLVVMPDTGLLSSYINSSDSTLGGWRYSYMRNNNWGTIWNYIHPALGQNNVVAFFSSMSDGVDVNTGTVTSTRIEGGRHELPTEIQIFGHRILQSFSDNLWYSKTTNEYTQFSLFRMNRNFIRTTNGVGYLLRDVVGSDAYAGVDGTGAPILRVASHYADVRPVVLIG